MSHRHPPRRSTAPARSAEAEPRYGIDELAARGGVSRRTVRYYVQLGLLDVPTGLGRGRHYTQVHLDQLIRIRELQERGVALADVPAHLAEGDHAPTSSQTPYAIGAQSTWTRIVVRDGLELHLRGWRLRADQVRALHAAVAQVIGEGEET